MPKPKALFKAAALMVVAGSSTDKMETVVQVMGNGHQAVLLNEEAAALLLDYLLIARAFFSTCEDGRQKLNAFCAKLLAGLHKESNGNVVSLPEMRQLIKDLGCLTEWVEWHQPANL